MKHSTLGCLLALALFGCHDEAGPADQNDSSGPGGSPDSGGAPTASDGAAGGSPSGGAAADATAGGSPGGASAGQDGGNVGTGALDAGTVDGGADASGELTPEQLVPNLDGYLYTGECSGAGMTTSYDCPMAGCSGNVFREQVKFAVAGVATKTYAVTLHIYGVAELRTDYKGGERRQAATSNAASGGDFWYAGGADNPGGSGYNVYQLRVTPAVDGVANPASGGNNYFLNARDPSGSQHEVWEINTEAVVPVKGGGTIEFTAYDPNCTQIMNNSETAHRAGAGPSGPLVVDLHDASPAPVSFAQPLSTNGRNGQWIYIDVVAIAAK